MTDQQLARLAGTEVSVGGPWDFEYPRVGTGLLRGRVSAAHVVDGDASEQGVSLKLDTPFVSEEGPAVRSLISRRRHASAEGIEETNAAGELVSDNLSPTLTRRPRIDASRACPRS